MKRALVALVVLAAAAARGDAPVQRPEAIEVDRDAPPPGRVEFGFDGGAPVGAWAFGVQLGLLDQPLRLHTVAVESYPVRWRETAALGGAVAFGRLVLDARLPLSHQSGDRYTAFGDPQPLEPWVIGDLRIGARIYIADAGPVSLFVRAEAGLPTGDDHNFAGEARWTAGSMIAARIALAAHVTLAATVGFRLRAAEVQLANETLGDELIGAIGATIGLPPICGLWCTPDQFKLVLELDGALGDHGSGEQAPSPAEARLGFVGQPRDDLTIGVHVGTHLDDQIGAPTFRAMLELAYRGAAPPPKPRAQPRVPSELDEDDERE